MDTEPRLAGLLQPPHGAEIPGARFGSLSNWTVFPALQLPDWLSIIGLEDQTIRYATLCRPCYSSRNHLHAEVFRSPCLDFLIPAEAATGPRQRRDAARTCTHDAERPERITVHDPTITIA